MPDAHTSDGEPRPNAPPGAAQLRSIVERYERVSDEIEELNDDRKEILAEAKANGYDPATIRKVAKLKNERPDQKTKRLEREAIFETYLAALGLLD